jgi:CRP-like cAMP-binding protein
MALLDHKPRAATIVAEDAMNVLVLDAREFHYLIEIAARSR